MREKGAYGCSHVLEQESERRGSGALVEVLAWRRWDRALPAWRAPRPPAQKLVGTWARSLPAGSVFRKQSHQLRLRRREERRKGAKLRREGRGSRPEECKASRQAFHCQKGELPSPATSSCPGAGVELTEAVGSGS